MSAAGEVLVRRLYDEHGAALLAYATRLMGSRAAGEDVVREALSRAWHTPDDQGASRAYLLSTVRTIALDRGRADAADGPLDPIVLLAVLPTLPAAEMAVLREVYFRGRSVAEAAAVLRIPSETVRTCADQALSRLRVTLGVSPEVVAA